MKQYAICAYQPDGPVPPPEVLGPIMEKVGGWRARLESAGAWVFTAGLEPPAAATVLRVTDGELADQDRSSWNRQQIAEGHQIVRACLRRNQPGSYQIQAAINAVHTDAATAAQTDWRQILQLYDQLMTIAPSHVVALNRAVAVAEVDGPAAALALTDGIRLDGYYLRPAVRADLLAKLGRTADASAEYAAAAHLTRSSAQRRFLERRSAELA
jgi:RNA polymerase sigma-70 factor, ECF subfamily